MAVKISGVAHVTNDSGEVVKQVGLIIHDAALVGSAVAAIAGHAELAAAIGIISKYVAHAAEGWDNGAQIEITQESIGQLFCDIPLVRPKDRPEPA